MCVISHGEDVFIDVYQEVGKPFSHFVNGSVMEVSVRNRSM